MKKVIFICLLSISMCLSAPSDPQGAPAQGQVPNAPTEGKPKPEAPPAPAPTAAPVAPPVPAAPNSVPPAPNAVPAANNSAPASPTSAPASPSSAPTSPTSAPTTHSTETANKTTTAPASGDKPTDKKEDKAPNSTADKTTTVAPHGDTVTTKPEDKTTVKPPTDKTEAPSKEGDKPQIVQARGFDGPSFIGGIILTLGLLAIGFMGFKYYKNQTERNYHTL